MLSRKISLAVLECLQIALTMVWLCSTVSLALLRYCIQYSDGAGDFHAINDPHRWTSRHCQAPLNICGHLPTPDIVSTSLTSVYYALSTPTSREELDLHDV